MRHEGGRKLHARTIAVDEEFLLLAKKIVAEGLDESQWVEIEADDMFQTTNYAGGFDATELAFCFSFFGDSPEELWFQLTLDELKEVALRVRTEFQVTSPA